MLGEPDRSKNIFPLLVKSLVHVQKKNHSDHLALEKVVETLVPKRQGMWKNPLPGYCCQDLPLQGKTQVSTILPYC